MPGQLARELQDRAEGVIEGKGLNLTNLASKLGKCQGYSKRPTSLPSLAIRLLAPGHGIYWIPGV